MRKSLVLGLLLGLSAHAGAETAFIKSFTPQNLSEPVNQVRAEFSTKMVDLTVNPDANIFDIRCTPQIRGRAQWSSQTTWTYDFQSDLPGNKVPGGSSCVVNLKTDYKKTKKITGKTEFQFRFDGPNVLAISPGSPTGQGKYTVVEDQTFLLGLDSEADEGTLLRNVRFKVDGIASLVDVRVLSEGERLAILRTDEYLASRFTGLSTIAIQPKRNFPPNAKVSLIFGKGIKSAESGLERQRDLVLNYETRPLLNARFSCTQENAKAGCSPFMGMEMTFTSDVPVDMAKQIRLIGRDEKGREVVIPAEIDPASKGETYVGRVTFNPPVKEKMTYRVEIPKGIKDSDGRALANQGEYPLTVKTTEFPPLAKFAADFGIIEANVKPVLMPATLRNIEAQVIGKKWAPATVTGQSVRITSSNFAEVVRWLKLLANKNETWASRDKSVFTGAKVKPAPFKVPLGQGGKAFEVVGIPLQSEGFHVVELQSQILGRSLLGKDKSMYVASGALVTNMVVHSKFGRESSLFWVTALDTGLPVSGAQVAITNCDGRAVVSGTSDSNGLFRYDGELKKKLDTEACGKVIDPSEYDGGFFVTASKGNDFTFTHSGWTHGIEPFRFGNVLDMNPMYSEQTTLTHTVLDRTLLRAGETVSMKHFFRVPTGQGFKLSDPSKLPNVMEITHVDSAVSEVYPITWNADGTAVAVYNIPKEAKLGLYQIALARQVNDQMNDLAYTSTFQVMEFKVPLMKGTISFPNDTESLVNPGRVNAQLAVKYQDGGPAVNEEVKFSYKINKSYGLNFEDFGWSMNFGAEKVEVGEKKTSDVDDSEVKTTEVPTRLNGQGVAAVPITGLTGFESPREIETQLEFTDKNSERQTVARSLTIYPAAKLTAVDVKRSFSSSKDVEFTAAVVDVKGKPLAGVTPRIEMFERTTFTHKTKVVGGFYGSESFTRIKKVQDIQCQGVTDKKGLMTCKARAPESGTFVIQASVSDENGNTSYGNDTVYVRGQRRAWFPADNNDRMDVVPDKKDYNSGDKAVLNVQMPFSQATALVTIEREGIVESFVKPISTDGTQAIEIPIKPEYAPNVYVSVLAVRGRASGPEETATVDLGKPAFKIGMTQLRVNWRDNSLKVAVKPLQEKVKPKQETSVEVTILNTNGKPLPNAEFAMAVVDEGLLTLAKNNTWDILRAMMGRRYLEVETATASMQVVGKRHFGMKAKPTGGDGGQAPTRELFDTLVKWFDRVQTDANGKAVVTFKMNDSMTKFRVVAIAHQGAGRFGTGEAKITSSLDIHADSSMSQVVRNGDRYNVDYSIRNQTESEKNVTLSATVKFTYADGRVETKTLPSQDVKLAANANPTVTLGSTEVPDLVVKVETVVTVTNSANNQVEDRVATVQTVKPSVVPRTYMAQLERLGATPRAVTVELPVNADKNQGGLKVDLVSSLTSGLTTVKSELLGYPFRSLESLVSKAVALNDQSIWNEAVALIPSHIDGEGLLMWFPSASTSQGSDVLTAYVLSMSNYSGFALPTDLQKRMIDGLTGYVEGRSHGSRNDKSSQVDLFIRRVNAIEVLARYGRAQTAWLGSLPRLAPEQVRTASLVDLLSIYANLKKAPARETKLAQLVGSLNARMTRIGTGMKLTDTQARPWFILSSEDMDQLDLILVIAKNDAELGPKFGDNVHLLVNGAVSMLKRGAWDLTVANAQGVLALRAYTVAFDSADGVSGVTEAALGAVIKSYNWNAQGAENGGTLTLGWPSTGQHKLDLNHKGTGTPWATVSVNAAIRLTEKLEKHISVEKTVTPKKTVYKKGDEVTVTLKIKPQTELPFVSLVDPIPAGAKILGSGLENDMNQGPGANAWVWPDYQELTYDSYRATYRSIPASGIEVVYRMHVNNAGTFKLPATRVEAIYLPENFAEVPNADVTVRP